MEGAAAAIPCVRDTIVQEYTDGDLCVRVKIDVADVDTFYACFPESNEAVFLANGAGAIEAIRGPIMREYKDGSLAFKLLIAPSQKRAFRELWPRPEMLAVLVREDPESGRQRMIDTAAAAPERQPARYGQLARALRLHLPFMGNPDVWRAVGTDDEFLAYLRTLRCAKCKRAPRFEGNDNVPNEAAHVRRVANGSGTAIKPPYSAVPLCHECHAEQHQYGEGRLGGKEHVDKLRLHYVHEWLWATLKDKLGYEHMSEVPPMTLVTWAEDHGLAHYLPDVYLHAI